MVIDDHVDGDAGAGVLTALPDAVPVLVESAGRDHLHHQPDRRRVDTQPVLVRVGLQILGRDEEVGNPDLPRKATWAS
ncbi:hypothetical protein [Streptomyces sp. NPDC047829]|uniref:hypothetical protein n=1 Tax=Streptomyces sp. NPDC047829 TaxID=3154609 RepID=UPI0033DD6703